MSKLISAFEAKSALELETAQIVEKQLEQINTYINKAIKELKDSITVYQELHPRTLAKIDESGYKVDVKIDRDRNSESNSYIISW